MNLSGKAPDWTGHTNQERLAHALHVLHEAGIIYDHERNTARQRIRAIERVRSTSRAKVAACSPLVGVWVRSGRSDDGL